VLGTGPVRRRADEISTTLNIFMNVWTDRTGALHLCRAPFGGALV